MSENEISEKILAILEDTGDVPGDSLQDKLNYRYLDAGHIDSLSIINFIVEVEETFGVELSPDDTQSDDFRSVGGLARMIKEKKE